MVRGGLRAAEWLEYILFLINVKSQVTFIYIAINNINLRFPIDKRAGSCHNGATMNNQLIRLLLGVG